MPNYDNLGQVFKNQRTEQIRFMSALIPLEYERNIAGFQKMQAEEAWEFSEHPDIYRHHLNVILLQIFEWVGSENLANNYKKDFERFVH